MNDNEQYCLHRHTCSYTSGFYCEDCGNFFDKASPTYRSTALLTSLAMVMNNINADRCRSGRHGDEDVDAMVDKLIATKPDDDYEGVIAEAEIIMLKYNVNSESASVTIGEIGQQL